MKARRGGGTHWLQTSLGHQEECSDLPKAPNDGMILKSFRSSSYQLRNRVLK